jgi:Arc/MetJ-type ribon-helix-helix transcriptional regulator
MRKKFGTIVHVRLPEELAEYLEDMVRRGEAESLSQAVRRCVSIAKTYISEVKSGGEKEAKSHE